MKKIYFAVIALLVIGILPVCAQGQQDKPKGYHPWDMSKNTNVVPDLTGFSFILHGGGNILDGDFHSERRSICYLPSAGLSFEYNFNPTWGIGADYTFRQYRVYGSQTEGKDNADILLDGMMHQAGAFITFDIFNCWRPQNKRKIFALDLMVGGGAAWFKNGIFYPNEFVERFNTETGEMYETYSYHTAQQEPQKDDRYKCYGVLTAGAMFEFNISRSLALGLRGVYNFYSLDELDGRMRGTSNDGVFDMELMLRWKIAAVKKTHVKNIMSKQALADFVGGDRLKDTLVIIHKDTVVMMPTTQIVEREIKTTDTITNVINDTVFVKERFYYIYFDNDSANLSSEGLITVQQLADRLKRDTELCAVVTASCDNTGTDAHNMRLSKRRASNVVSELVFEHGIDPERIVINALGKIRGGRSEAGYAPNRRVEAELMTKENFIKFKAEMNGSN